MYGSTRDDYVLRVQAKAQPLRELVQVPVHHSVCLSFFAFVPEGLEPAALREDELEWKAVTGFLRLCLQQALHVD